MLPTTKGALKLIVCGRISPLIHKVVTQSCGAQSICLSFQRSMQDRTNGAHPHPAHLHLAVMPSD